MKVNVRNREAVQKAAADLGYVPNEAARSLRVVRTMTVGMVFNELTGPLGMELLGALASELDQNGYSLFVSTALTLVMVPVMIVAPKVAGHQIARFFIGLWHLPGRLFRMVFPVRRKVVTPEGEVIEVADEAPATPAIPKPANDEDPNRQAAE